ncbi:MAG: hypothetical protein QOC62_3705 [Mycobacterium sp.]|jgi:hypothetical protein|nr:hypothetical protein [Mycobacterium sp.]
MNADELTIWADRHGKVLIPNAEYAELCARAAAGITAKNEVDKAFNALFSGLMSTEKTTTRKDA